MGDRVSNRELNDQKEREELKKDGLGDLIAEMVAIGDPTDVYTKRSRGKVKRAKFIQEELNRRLKPRKAANKTSTSE